MKLSDLEGLGLSEIQAKVYFAVLRNGRMTLTAIARYIQSNRTTLYPHASTLCKKGFLVKSIRGKRTYYNANSPQKLRQEFNRKQQYFESLMPELSSLYTSSTHQPTVKVYEGREGIAEVFNIVADNALYVKTFFAPDKYQTLLSLDTKNKEGNYFLMQTEKNGVKAKGLCSDTPEGRSFLKKYKDIYMDMCLMPEGMSFPVEFMVYNQTLIIVSFTHQFALMIDNPDIREFIEKLFDHFWSYAKPLSES